uniref:dTDP-4-dehydrorhamnose 3,5-epimerase n=1 Tax=viral metagenome TaxID=1070528 RepID=A0A6C0F881_9ZZZZ|tara:strand:+ start:4116 stop:4667 length:552 start_codon:yes stop_codon:yes gene_type:complete
MYRILPLRTLRRTAGVIFDEVSKSDIPKIDGIDRVIHKANGISPGPVDNVMRPWYMHTGQDDNLIVLQGERFIDIYCPVKKEKASFIVTPDNVYKNGKLYCAQPAMVVWPSGIFHRIISGSEGSISLNFATRTEHFNLDTNFHIYDLDTTTGEYKVIRDGKLDQPDLMYKFKDNKTKALLNIM